MFSYVIIMGIFGLWSWVAVANISYLYDCTNVSSFNTCSLYIYLNLLSPFWCSCQIGDRSIIVQLTFVINNLLCSLSNLSLILSIAMSAIITFSSFFVCFFKQIFVKDVWKEYTGWPLNNMESQYKFMVQHVQLWKVAFHTTSPRWIHRLYLAAVAAFYAKYILFSLLALFTLV